MADINGVTLNAGSNPTVKYTITYTKSRPNNSQMTYNFTISAAQGSSGYYIHNGYALLCTMTVGGSSAQVRIKAADNDDWDGTTPRVRTVSVTCSSTIGNATQAVTFQVVSDGRLTLTSGVITNSSYTVLSSALLYTACGAPSACAESATVGEGNVTLSWSGASGGTNNSITSYEIQYSDSSNNSTWGSWSALTTVTTTATSGSVSVSPPATRGYYRRFQVRTCGSAGSSYYSGWKVSTNSVRKNIEPRPVTTLTATPPVYSTESVTLTWSGAVAGTSAIKQYVLQQCTSADGVTWSVYENLATVQSSATSGSYAVTPSAVAGTYTRYRISVTDILGAVSAYVVSNTVKKNSPPPAPTVIAPKAGSSTYNLTPRFLITTGTEPDGQAQKVCVKLGNGEWQDSVGSPELFSVSGHLENKVSTIFRAQEQTNGSKTVAIRCLDQEIGSSSGEVSRTVTVLPSPFETITANVTKVKAVHIQSLRGAVNTVRNYYGLSIVSWSAEITAGKTYVRDWPFHILEIRKAVEPVVDLINQFDAASTFDVPEVEWLPIGTGRAKAAVINQLQTLILAL